MIFKHFSVRLSMRVSLTLLTLILLSWLIQNEGYLVTSLVLLACTIALVTETLRFVNKTNAELTRFVDALRYGDYTQKFSYQEYGNGFEQLGLAFSDILQRFQQDREQQEQRLRYVNALVEQVPVPLISVNTQEQMTQWNHSARRLFGSHLISKVTDVQKLSAQLSTQLRQLQVGEQRLVNVNVDGMSHQLALSATQISVAGTQEKLISLQDISSELDMAQLQAWQDLVRVLTHEIMNSITPIASLANTAADLVNDLQSEQAVNKIQPELGDIQDAVQTLSKRSSSLIQFVSGYRRLTRLPSPQLSQVLLSDLVEQVARIATQGWADKGIQLSTDIQPLNLRLQADSGMLEQIFINLLQNAEQALASVGNAQVNIAASLNRRNRIVIQVTDNGPGIDKDIIERVFVPFFTTKREGSGVGLALTRQIMIAHGGSARVENIATGGACFTLTF